VSASYLAGDARMKSGGKLKVMHLLPSLEVGGTERLLCDFLHEVKSYPNVENSLVVVNNRVDKVLVDFLSDHKIPTTYISRNPGSRSLASLFLMISLIRTEKPEYVHAHNFFTLVLALFARLSFRKFKIFFTVHTTGSISESNTLKRLCFKCIPDGTIAISNVVFNECVNAKMRNVRMIYNGINISKFAKPSEKKTQRKDDFVCVARLNILQKGQDILISALAEMKARKRSTTLGLVGDAAEGSDDRLVLEKLAVQLDVKDSVRFYGTRHDIAAYLHGAKIFVLPSRVEGFGLSIVEAMASGLPIIAAAAGGISEILDQGKYGILVHADDVKALATAMESLLNNQVLREEYAKKSLIRVEDFSIEKMVSSYILFYLSQARAASGKSV
jgi:glycosyltransferase involved in cell wall biosynthesis